MNWFHKFFNPHCLDCKEDYLDQQVCDSCNTLRIENQALRKHNDQLIQALLDKVKPKEEVVPSQVVVTQPVNSNLSWRARRHILEVEDRKTAELKREKRKEMDAIPITSVDKLEEELGVDDAIRSSNA
jgi:hypothetical protein